MAMAWRLRGLRSGAVWQSVFSIAMRGASVLCNLGAVTIALSLVGAHRYGQLVLIVAMSTWLLLCSVGTTERLTQLVVSAMEKGGVAGAFPAVKATFLTTAVAGLVGALAAIDALVLLVQRDMQGDAYSLAAGIIVLATIALLTPLQVSGPLLVGQGLIAKDAFYRLLQPVSNLAFGLCCLLPFGWSEGQALVWLSIAYALSFVISRVAGIIGSGGLSFLRASISRPLLRDLASASWPFFLVQVAATLAFQTDKFMVNAFGTTSELGSYDVLLRLYSALYLVANVPVQYLWRDVAAFATRRDTAGLRRHVFTFAAASGMFWVVATMLAAGIMPFATGLLSGDKLSPPGTTVIVLVGLFFLIRGTTDIFTVSLYALGQQKRTVLPGLAHGLTHVAFAWIGGSWYGITGVLVGQALSFAVTTFAPFMAMLLRHTPVEER